MTGLPPEFLAAFETAAPGASGEALACFLWLLSRRGASPAGLSKALELPQAAVFRALGELEVAGLVLLSAPRGRAGRRKAALTEKAIKLSAGLDGSAPPRPTRLRGR